MRPTPGTSASKPLESPFRLIFDHAWTRLGKSRAFRRWEILIWSVIAAHTGFELFGFYSAEFDLGLSGLLFTIAAILTPPFIGGWVYRTHVLTGLADDALRVLPVRSVDIVGARTAAVAFRWLRTLGVPALFGIHLFHPGPANLGPLQLWYEAFVPRFVGTPVAQLLWVFGTAAIASFCWAALPLSGAMYWGSRIRRSGGSFFLAYYSYLIVVAVLAYVWMAFVPTVVPTGVPSGSTQSSLPDYIYDLPGPIGHTLGVVLGLALCFVLFGRACVEWGRRSR